MYVTEDCSSKRETSLPQMHKMRGDGRTRDASNEDPCLACFCRRTISVGAVRSAKQNSQPSTTNNSACGHHEDHRAGHRREYTVETVRQCLTQLQGYKSYAVRTVITGWFVYPAAQLVRSLTIGRDESFNSITGLNGSGKSNILDSICFVLGITNLGVVRAQNLQVGRQTDCPCRRG